MTIYFNEYKRTLMQPIPNPLCVITDEQWEEFKYLKLGYDYDIIEGVFTDLRETPEHAQEEERKRQEYILSLSMTRSDFFDGMIKAFGIGQEELKQAIILVLGNIQITDIEKKIALNNYDNALNFYRKHPLFTMLSNIPIPVTENITITITTEQWNNFFVKTSEKDANAYKELLP